MTKNLRCLIIDDEQNAIDALTIILNEYIDNVEVVGTAQSALEGVKQANKLKPDIVFLDVDMPGGSGFDFLDALPDYKFKVVFTTASSDHAIKAVKARAEDYLLKPIDIDELQKTIEKCINTAEKNVEKLALPKLGGFIYVNFADIINVEGEGNYTTFFMKNNEKHLISKNIGYFADKLNFHPFFRCHQSFIVNLLEIKELNKNDGTFCIMNNNKRVDVSRANKEDLLNLLGN